MKYDFIVSAKSELYNSYQFMKMKDLKNCARYYGMYEVYRNLLLDNYDYDFEEKNENYKDIIEELENYL